MDPTTAMYLAQGIHGLVYGLTLFLVASGLTLIFGMMGIMNMAHPYFLLLGAYFAYSAMKLTGNFWLALLLGPIAAGFAGLLLERFFLNKVQALGNFGQLILTMGVALLIVEGVKVFWGGAAFRIAVPEHLNGLVSLGGLDYPKYRLFIVALSLSVLGVMTLILYLTRLGMIVRAAVSDADMVSVLGINMPLVSMITVGIGTWLAGVAGVALAPILTVYPGLADHIWMDAFMVVVVGGLGSLGGAFLVSIIYGLMYSYGIQFISQLAPLSMFAFMAVVLALKPRGLFGKRE